MLGKSIKTHEAGEAGHASGPALPQQYDCVDRSAQRTDDLVPVLYVLIEDFPHPRNPQRAACHMAISPSSHAR